MKPFDLYVQGAAASIEEKAGKCWNGLPKESESNCSSKHWELKFPGYGDYGLV